VLAVIGAFFGYFVLGVHNDRLGVVVAVPLLVAFGLSRLLVLSVPHDPMVISIGVPDKASAIAVLATAIAVFLCVSSSLVLALSAGIYQAIDMHSAAINALLWAGCGMSFCLLILVLTSLVVYATHLSIVDWFIAMGGKLVFLFWQVLCAPSRIARFIGETFPLSHSH
jgi:uncharacterized protein YacL